MHVKGNLAGKLDDDRKGQGKCVEAILIEINYSNQDFC